MGEIIFTVFCIVVFGIALCFTIKEEEAGVSSFITLILCVLFVVLVASLVEDTPKEKSLKSNTLKIEVRETKVNGIVSATDTVYIFTPKKKN